MEISAKGMVIEMRELDFLFVYEHKVRELENLCLIKYELDRRGYRTEIRYIEDAENELAIKPFIHAKVLLVMACYNNQTLRWQTKNFVKYDKVIDMQWENIVYPKDEGRKDAYKNYTEIGKDVVRVSWGKQNEKRMLDVAKMNPKKLKVTGHVGMDFLRPPLTAYYLSREELFRKYELPTDKKVILFASPYYGDCLEESYIADMCMRFGDDWREYYQFMCRSQEQVLDWMQRILQEDSGICFIFRPHPGHPSKIAEKMAAEYENFKIIAGESVKQWIVTCDKVYTGNSSVVVEAFFAKKMCQLLFPLPVTKGYELKLISESRKITDYGAFKASLYAREEEFPTPVESIEEIYQIDWEEPSYIKFADMAEEVLRDDFYLLTSKQIKGVRQDPFPVKLTRAAGRVGFLYNGYLKLLENEKIQWKFLQNQRTLRQRAYDIERAHAHELADEEEIEGIIDKIRKALSAQ